MEDQKMAEEAVQVVELTEHLAECYLSGIAPQPAELKLAAELGVNTEEIRRTCEDCYDETSNSED